MNLDSAQHSEPFILPLDSSQLIIHVGNESAWKPTEEQESAWQARCRANPRLFNGRMLAATAWKPPTLRATLATYKQFITARDTTHRVTQVGVTGVVFDQDSAHAPHVLLGLRSPQTGIYPNMWELAPSGGLDPPSQAPANLTIDHVRTVIRHEAAEELGIHLQANIHPALLCFDPHAPSLDIVCLVPIARTKTDIDLHAHAAHWEYQHLRWLECSPENIEAWLTSHTTIPPSAIVLRWLASHDRPSIY